MRLLYVKGAVHIKAETGFGQLHYSIIDNSEIFSYPLSPACIGTGSFKGI